MTKVLLVEDDNNLREIYEARLAAEGYEIATAEDGEDALAVAKQQKPDLIISDVMMPRISGFEMLDILRNTDGLKNTKVIMLTALGQAEDKTRADSLGADRYLVKSQVTLEDIVKAADELLNPDAYAEEGATPAAGATTSPEPAAASTPAVPATNNAFAAPPELAAVDHQQTPTEPSVAPAQPVISSMENMPPAATPTPPAATPTSDPLAVAAAPIPEPAINAPAQDATAPAAAVVIPEPTLPAAEPTTPTAEAEIPSIPVVETPPEAPEEGAAAEQVIQMPSNPVEPEVAAAAAAAEVQSTSQEAATVEQQIENFVSTAPSTPATAVTPELQAPAGPPTADQNHEQLIETAADELQKAEPQLYVSPNEVTGKKVISPPQAEAKADLQALLAQEEAKTQATTVGGTVPPVVPATPVAPVQAAPTPTPAAPAPVAPAADGSIAPMAEGIFSPNQNGSANEQAL